MKKIISIFFVAVWAMVSMSSCGGDEASNTPAENVNYEDEASKKMNELCGKFGIKASDYYTKKSSPLTVGDELIVTFLRKSDNIVFIGIYNEVEKTIVYTNTDIQLQETLNTPYYENTFEGKIASISPKYMKTENGFIMNVMSYYTSDGNSETYMSMCVQNLVSYDGQKTVTKQYAPTTTPMYKIEKWYKNSCLLGVTKYTCVTDKGEIKFNDKTIYGIMSGQNFPVDYYRYMNFYKNEVKLHDATLDETDVRYNATLWREELYFIRGYENAKIEYSVEDDSRMNWVMNAKMVWENGKTIKYTFEINPQTGYNKEIKVE